MDRNAVERPRLVAGGSTVIFAMLVSCFALWGLLNNMTDNLVPAFQRIFMTSQSTAGYVQISFYGAYSVIAVFASLLVQKAGYRCGVLVGLGVYVIGALLYVGCTLLGYSSWPAAALSSRRRAIRTCSPSATRRPPCEG